MISINIDYQSLGYHLINDAKSIVFQLYPYHQKSSLQKWIKMLIDLMTRH